MSRPQTIQIVIFLMALVLGWVVTQHGMLYFPDEYRYFWPLNIWEGLQTGDYARVTGLLQEAMTRPLYLSRYTPVLGLQYWLSGQASVVDTPSGWVSLHRCLWVPGLFQATLYAVSGWCVYRIGQRWFQHERTAIVTQILWLLWVPVLFYTRHVLPTLAANTALLAAILCLSEAQAPSPFKNPSDIGHTVKPYRPYSQAGAWWMIGLMIYPAIVSTMLPILGWILWPRAVVLRQRLLQALRFGGATVSALLSAELITQVAQQSSFIGNLFHAAQFVNQGDADAGVAFVLDYFWHLSPVLLMVTLTLLIRGLWACASDSIRNGGLLVPISIQSAMTLAMLSLLLWVWLTTDVLHLGVVYARFLLPFSILGVFLLGAQLNQPFTFNISSKPASAGGSVVVVVVIVLGVLWPLPGFLSQRFPYDVLSAFKQQHHVDAFEPFLHSSRRADFEIATRVIGTVPVGFTRTVSITPVSPETLDCEALHRALRKSISQSGTPSPDSSTMPYLLTNVEYIYPVGTVHSLASEVSAASIKDFSWAHPMTLAVYQYDGLTRQERQRIQDRPIHMQVIQQPCQTNTTKATPTKEHS